MHSCMPYAKDILFQRSLFERMIIGEGGFCVLNQQVRMGKVLLEFVQSTIVSQSLIHGKPLHQSCLNGPYLQKPEAIPVQKICPKICFYDLKYLPELKWERSHTDRHECFFVLTLLSKIARLCLDLEKK